MIPANYSCANSARNRVFGANVCAGTRTADQQFALITTAALVFIRNYTAMFVGHLIN